MNKTGALHHPVGKAKAPEIDTRIRVAEEPGSKITWSHDNADLIRTVSVVGEVTHSIDLGEFVLDFYEDGDRALKVFQQIIRGDVDIIKK